MNFRGYSIFIRFIAFSSAFPVAFCSTELPKGTDAAITRVRASGKVDLSMQTTLLNKQYSLTAFQDGKFKGALWTDHATDSKGTVSSGNFISSLSTDYCQNSDTQIFDGGTLKIFLLFNTNGTTAITIPSSCAGSEGYLRDAEKAAVINIEVDGDTNYAVQDYMLTDSIATSMSVSTGTGSSAPVLCHVSAVGQEGKIQNRFQSVAAFPKTSLAGGSATISSVNLPASNYSVYCLLDSNDNGKAESGEKEGKVTDVAISSSSTTFTVDAFVDIP